LTFNFIDSTEKESNSKSLASMPIDKDKTKKDIPKEYFPVKVNAIPIIDGSHIKSEYDVVELLGAKAPAKG
jgi:hypothetical protein